MENKRETNKPEAPTILALFVLKDGSRIVWTYSLHDVKQKIYQG